MDNKFYNSDKKTADQGWSAMRQMLDRELPVQRRRFGLFWLLVSLLLVGGLLSWAALRPDNVKPVRKIRQPIATTEHSKPSLQPKTPAMHPQAATARISPEIIWAKPQVAEAAENASLSSQRSIALSSVDLKKGYELEKQDRTSGQSGIETEIVENAASINSAEDFISATEMNPLPLLSAIDPAPASTNLVVFTPQPFILLPIEPAVKKRPKAWSLGATTGVLSSLSLGYTGANIGPTAEWQPRRHWGLRAGLGYQLQSPPENERPIVSLSSASYVSVTGDQNAMVIINSTGANPLLDNSAIPVYVPVARLHRLELPLLAFWQPFPKWRLYGGGTFGANIQAQTGSRSLIDNKVLVVQDGTPAQNLNKEITDKLHDWDLQWSLGIGFKPNRRFAFDLFLRNPIKRGSGAGFSVDNSGDPLANFESVGKQIAADRPANTSERYLLQMTATVFF